MNFSWVRKSHNELLSDVSEINYHLKICKSWIIDLIEDAQLLMEAFFDVVNT